MGPKKIRGRAAWVYPEELACWIRENRAPLLVDVREAGAWAAGHVPGSVNLPDSDTVALVRRLSIADTAILICDDAEMSAMVARTLDYCGLTRVSYLDGGLTAWTGCGLPVARATSKQKCLTPPSQPSPAPPVFPTDLRAALGESVGAAINRYVVGAAVVGSALVIVVSLWLMKML